MFYLYKTKMTKYFLKTLAFVKPSLHNVRTNDLLSSTTTRKQIIYSQENVLIKETNKQYELVL